MDNIKLFEERLKMSLPMPPGNPSQLQLCKQQIENEKNRQMIESYQSVLDNFAAQLSEEGKRKIDPLLTLCQTKLKN